MGRLNHYKTYLIGPTVTALDLGALTGVAPSTPRKRPSEPESQDPQNPSTPRPSTPSTPRPASPLPSPRVNTGPTKALNVYMLAELCRVMIKTPKTNVSEWQRVLDECATLPDDSPEAIAAQQRAREEAATPPGLSSGPATPRTSTFAATVLALKRDAANRSVLHAADGDAPTPGGAEKQHQSFMEKVRASVVLFSTSTRTTVPLLTNFSHFLTPLFVFLKIGSCAASERAQRPSQRLPQLSLLFRPLLHPPCVYRPFSSRRCVHPRGFRASPGPPSVLLPRP